MDAQRVILGVLAWYGVWSVVSFAMYWRDKRAAVRGARRAPERALLTADLIGGWPGGWIARRAFRHKTRRVSYRARFYGVVLVHVVAWVGVLWIVGRGAGWWGRA